MANLQKKAGGAAETNTNGWNAEVARETGIRAVYVGRGKYEIDPISGKAMKGTGHFKKFYKYNLNGPAKEMELFRNSDAVKEYGEKTAPDGTLQYWCNWKDAFGTIGTSYSLKISGYGTYVLDKSESEDFEDTLEAQEKVSPILAREFARGILQNRFKMNVDMGALDRVTEKMSEGEGADLGTV